MENRTRKKSRIIRFTEEEKQYIDSKVSLSRMGDFQTYALHMLIQGEVKTVDYSSLNQLVGEVRRIGSNINQVAKLAHQFSEIATDDIKQLTEVMEKLNQLVESTLEEEMRKEKYL